MTGENWESFTNMQIISFCAITIRKNVLKISVNCQKFILGPKRPWFLAPAFLII